MGLTRLLAALLATLAVDAEAAFFLVTNTNDTGPGSLRAAITAANTTPDPPHTIRFDGTLFPSQGTIVLQSTLPSLNNGRLTIDGDDRQPTISGQDTYSILVAGFNLSVLEVRNLKLTQGRRVRGGCIEQTVNNLEQSLIVRNSVFEDCTATGSSLDAPRGGAITWNAFLGAVFIQDSLFIGNVAGTNTSTIAPSGGALHIASSLNVINSTFIGNSLRRAGTSSGGFGGAIWVDPRGGVIDLTSSSFVDNDATSSAMGNGEGGAVLVNCVIECVLRITGNHFASNASGNGGALALGTFSSEVLASAQLLNNTFVNNEAVISGGAILTEGVRLSLDHNTFLLNGALAGAHLRAFPGTVVNRLVHNAFAGRARGSACLIDGNPTAQIAATNLFGDMSCAGFGSAGAVQVADFRVAGIDTGGSIDVVRFAADSPVVDAVQNASLCASVDARATARPLDGDFDGVARCDVGAFEHPGDAVFGNGFEPGN